MESRSLPAGPRQLLESVQDPNEVVKLLCSKFSQLIDKVAQAEDGVEVASKKAEQMRQKVQESAERRQGTTSQMQSSLRTQLAEAEAAQLRLKEARANADFAAGEVSRAKEVAHSLNEDCERLSSQCREEQRSLEETSGRMADEEKSSATCERDRQRLRAEVEALSQRLAAQEEELAADYQRDRQRRGDVRQLEMRLQDTGRQRLSAEKRLQSVQEELSTTQKQVHHFKERLEAAQQKLQLGHEELQELAGSLEEAQKEQVRVQEEELLTREGVARLRQIKASVESHWHEKVEADGQLKAAQLKKRRAQELSDTVDMRQKEALARLASLIDCTAAKGDLERWQQRLKVLEDSVQELRCTLQDLEVSTKGANSVGMSLQEELQRVFLATETLRREREEAAQNPALVKLRQAEPALEASRRRARELEMKLEDVQGEVVCAKQRKECFLREVRQSREKMRGLRKRHTVLWEKAQGLEKRLLRSPLVPGLGEVLQSSKVTRTSGALRPVVTPMEKEPEAEVRQAPVQAPTPIRDAPERQDLDYLRQWVEMEEARLELRQTPPLEAAAPET